MQLTGRQHEFARIVVWALPVSAVLGAVFGHLSAVSEGILGYVQGAVAGILISGAIVLLQFAVFSPTRSALARRVPFLVYLTLRVLGYLAAILMGLAVSAWLVRQSPSEPLIQRSGVIFSLVLSLGFNLFYGVNDLLGQGVFFSFVAGRYRRPRIEERVLLFIDMEGSTVIAERLGETGFLDFLNRFVADVTESVVAQHGAIHKYVGDEIIVTWRLPPALRTGVASAPASTPWRSWTSAPTPTCATSACGRISAPRCIAGPSSSASSAPSRWRSHSSATP